MEALTVDIILFLCAAFSLAYTSYFFARAKKEHFYNFMYLAVIAFFVGRVYNLIFELSGGDSYFFTLGDLGNVSGFLFCSYAILELREEKKIFNEHKKSFYPWFAPTLIVAMWLAMFFRHLSFSKMILASMYLLTSTLCSYLCISAICDTSHSDNPYRHFASMWGVIAVLNILTMVGELFWILDDSDFTDILALVVLALLVVCYLLLPVLLERGRRKCRA